MLLNSLTDESYGQTYAANASVIAKAGSWSKVNTASLKWGVKDADNILPRTCCSSPSYLRCTRCTS